MRFKWISTLLMILLLFQLLNLHGKTLVSYVISFLAAYIVLAILQFSKHLDFCYEICEFEEMYYIRGSRIISIDYCNFSLIPALLPRCHFLLANNDVLRYLAYIWVSFFLFEYLLQILKSILWFCTM